MFAEALVSLRPAFYRFLAVSMTLSCLIAVAFPHGSSPGSRIWGAVSSSLTIMLFAVFAKVCLNLSRGYSPVTVISISSAIIHYLIMGTVFLCALYLAGGGSLNREMILESFPGISIMGSLPLMLATFIFGCMRLMSRQDEFLKCYGLTNLVAAIEDYMEKRPVKVKPVSPKSMLRRKLVQQQISITLNDMLPYGPRTARSRRRRSISEPSPYPTYDPRRRVYFEELHRILDDHATSTEAFEHACKLHAHSPNPEHDTHVAFPENN